MLELLSMICLAAAWLVPNHYPPWSSFYSETCSGLALLLLCIGNTGRIRSQPVPTAAWVVLAVAAIPLLQWTFGLLAFSGDVWISALYLGGLSAAIVCGSIWAQRDPRNAAAMLSGAVLVAGAISSAIALAQFFHVGQFGLWGLDIGVGARSVGNIGQPNNLASLLGMSAVSLLLLYEQGRLGGTAGILLLSLLLGGAATTQSRTALLFGPIVLAGLDIAKRRGLRFRTGGTSVVLVTFAQWILAWALPALQTAMALRGSVSLAARGLETPRLQMWPMLLDATTQVPWHGYGWLQVGEAELAVVNKYPPVNELWLHGHNLFLEFIVWCGYPLGLLLSALVVYWFVDRALKAATVEAVVGMLSIAVLGAHAMLELPHHYAYFLIPAGLWIGQVEYGRGLRGIVPAKWNLLPAFLSVFLAVAIWKDYPAVEEDFRLVRFENLRIGSVHAAQPAPDGPFLSSLTEFLRFARTTPVKGMSEAELSRMEAVAKRYPYAPSLSRLATAQALNGRMDKARENFISIRQMFGEGTYMKLRRDLQEEVIDGEPSELIVLEQSLPN